MGYRTTRWDTKRAGTRNIRSLAFRNLSCSFYQRGERAQRFTEFEEWVLQNETREFHSIEVKNTTHLQQLTRRRPLLRVHLESLRKVITKYRRECVGIRDRGSPIRRDEVERFQWVLIEIRGLAFDHF